MRLLTIVLVLGLVSGGCRSAKRRMHASEIHEITRELKAASTSAATGAEVGSEFSATDEERDTTDRLYVMLHPEAADTQSSAAQVARLLQAMGQVATRHGLTQDAPSNTGDAVRFTYSRSGFATHSIRIQMLAPSAGQEARSGPSRGVARLAIILDDVGTDRGAAEAIFALRYALTISVLPNRPHSVEIAKEAHRRGYQVMLHLPMESLVDGKPEPQELRHGMRANDVAALVHEFLRAVPDVTGVNNHQGSQSTADVALMDALMPVLRERKLFYIDSRTTKETVAYDAARQAGVRCASRNVPFLDDVVEASAVRKQLELALRGAKEKGEAVAIGHPHAATLAALKEILPQAKAQGVQLVFASELVH
jgi:polysaccharide deacetylase 2 family uncharacterized protein YibQ